MLLSNPTIVQQQNYNQENTIKLNADKWLYKRNTVLWKEGESDHYGDLYASYTTIRGTVELRRIFNNDQFVIEINYAYPSYKHVSFSPILLINNKMINLDKFDISAVDTNSLTLKYNLRYTTNKKIWDYNGNITYHNILINSSDLKMDYKDLWAINLQFANNKWAQDINAVELKKDSTNKYQNTFNIKSNYARLEIPEKYTWFFGDIMYKPKEVEKVSYYTIDAKFNKLARMGRTNKLVSIEGYSDNSQLRTHGSRPDYFGPNGPSGGTIGIGHYVETFKPFLNIYEQFYLREYSLNKPQSTSNYGFSKFSNNFIPEKSITMSSDKKDSVYLGRDHKDIIDFYYNQYSEYNYETKSIFNSKNVQDKGTFIPYNFKGDFINEYNFYFQNTNEAKPKTFDITINTEQFINNRLLDENEGLIKLNSEDKDQVDITTDKLRYIFNEDAIEGFIKNNNMTTDVFEHYLKK